MAVQSSCVYICICLPRRIHCIYIMVYGHWIANISGKRILAHVYLNAHTQRQRRKIIIICVRSINGLLLVNRQWLRRLLQKDYSLFTSFFFLCPFTLYLFYWCFYFFSLWLAVSLMNDGGRLADRAGTRSKMISTSLWQKQLNICPPHPHFYGHFSTKKKKNVEKQRRLFILIRCGKMSPIHHKPATTRPKPKCV